MHNEMKYLRNLFFSAVNDKSLLKSCLEKKELSPLSEEIQKRILGCTIGHTYVNKYAPPLQFQKSFLRTLIEEVESNGSEPSDDLIETYANLMCRSEADNYIYRTYIVEESCFITLQESQSFVLNGTTGLQTWEGSKFLLEWCLENISIIQLKRILELGSGIGLLGIAIVKLCHPIKYLCSDGSWDVLNKLTDNIQINIDHSTAEHMMEIHQFSWGELNNEYINELAPDVILGADVVFDPSIIPSLVKTLKMFFVNDKTRCAYIASTIRNADTDTFFISQLDSAELSYEVLNYQHKNQFIYKESTNFKLYKIFLKEN